MDSGLYSNDNRRMFIRSVKIPSSSGQIHEYVRIVASVREGGTVKQKVIANLGRRDTLEELLPQLNRFLKGNEKSFCDEQGSIEMIDASTWGPMMTVRWIVQELRLVELMNDCARIAESKKGRRSLRTSGDDWQSRIVALISNRLINPTSEHGLAAWLESDYVCDRSGRRYVPEWKQSNRVKVDFKQLQRWYRSLDRLIALKDELEVGLYYQLRDLFSLEPDLVLFDITSTYFEGNGPPSAKHGYSRDGKPRQVQVIVGVVMVAGWPIAHYVWEGNVRDSTTVPEVISDLKQRFKFKRIVFVGDRGMVSQSNLELLQADESTGFLVGMNRRRNSEAEELIDRIDDSKWIDCPGGINTREKAHPPRTRVQEVLCAREGVRVFVVDSDERRDYEQRMRLQSMSRVLKALQKVQVRVETGKLKSPEKIGAAVERVLQKNHGHRYYDWKLQDGQLSFYEHPVNLAREKKYEGKYIIQTDQQDITAGAAVQYYKELNEVERGFRSLKDPIAMRPICHRADKRVQAHIFIAALAFLVERFMERKLKQAGVQLSVRDALDALKTIRFVRFTVNGKHKSGLTPGSPRARQTLKALGITSGQPANPQNADQTIV